MHMGLLYLCDYYATPPKKKKIVPVEFDHYFNHVFRVLPKKAQKACTVTYYVRKS